LPILSRHDGFLYYDTWVVKVYQVPITAWLTVTYIRKIRARALRSHERSRIAPYIHTLIDGIIRCNGRPTAPRSVHFYISHLLRMTGHTTVGYKEVFSPCSPCAQFFHTGKWFIVRIGRASCRERGEVSRG